MLISAAIELQICGLNGRWLCPQMAQAQLVASIAADEYDRRLAQRFSPPLNRDIDVAAAF